MKPVIKLSKATKMYGAVRGVEDVSFEVHKGRVFGFLGPNGAGKTTSINMMLDFIRPTNGSVELFGLDAQKDSLAIRQRIGFLAGDMAMDRGLTGWQQLEYLGNLHGHFDKAYVGELADRLGAKLERKFKTLSRGNKQKVGLIAALMNKPELLILDEPTSGLDPLMQAEFNKMILEHKKRGGTTLISSHMLSEVQELCDEAAFIRDGKLVAVKPIAELTDEAPKRFRLVTGNAQLKKSLAKLSGVTIEDDSNGALIGAYFGDVNLLLRLVAKYNLNDFILEDADLEAAFMSYYQSEGIDA